MLDLGTHEFFALDDIIILSEGNLNRENYNI